MSNRFESMSKTQQRLLLLGVLAGVFLFFCALGEFILYLRHSDSVAADLLTITRDPQTGLPTLEPNKRDTGFLVNSDGFRSPEITKAKSEGSLRIAFLGASTTFNAEVEDNTKTWPYLVVEALRAAFPEKQFDFLNAAVSGYGISTSHKAWTVKVSAYQPDLVVIYHGTNDLYRNTLTQAQEDGVVSYKAPNREGWLERNSRLVGYLMKNGRIMWRGAFPNEAAALKMDPERVGQPFTADLNSLVRDIKSACAVPVLVGFVPRIRREQTLEQRKTAAITNRYYMPFMSLEGLVDGYELYYKLAAEIAEREAVPFIGDREMIPGDAEHYTDSVHFNAQGNARMADRVAAGILNNVDFDRLKPAGCVAPPSD